MEAVVAQAVGRHFSSVGMLDRAAEGAAMWPKPMSSISTITTFGAPSGALTSKRGGALALRASSSLMTATAGSWIGRTVRSSPPSAFATTASFFAQETANNMRRQHETGAQNS